MSPTPRVRACAVCLHDGNVLLLHLKDPGSGKIYEVPPGGEVESGETPAEAAARETWEETGYRVQVDPETEDCVHYPFVWNGKTYQCKTYFYLATLLTPDHESPVDPQFVLKMEWCPVESLAEKLAFEPEICSAALRVLERVKKMK